MKGLPQPPWGQSYKQGDAFSRRFVEQTARYLASGLISIVNTLNPRLVIFGGGVVNGIPDLITLTVPHVQSHALTVAVERVRFANAALGPSAVVIGAASHARTPSKGHTP